MANGKKDNTNTPHQDIAYLFTNTNMEGNGVFIGNALITSAHIVSHSNTFSVGGKNYLTMTAKCYKDNDYWYKKILRILTLNKFGWNYDDFAIYGTNSTSPFTLSHSYPLVDDILETYSLNNEVEQQSGVKSNSVFSFVNNRHLVMHIDTARVLYVRGNYIFCKMNGMLGKGRSGCPLMKNHIVYGILRGGDDKNICWFQSSVSIIKRLHEESILISNLSHR